MKKANRIKTIAAAGLITLLGAAKPAMSQTDFTKIIEDKDIATKQLISKMNLNVSEDEKNLTVNYMDSLANGQTYNRICKDYNSDFDLKSKNDEITIEEKNIQRIGEDSIAVNEKQTYIQGNKYGTGNTEPEIIKDKGALMTLASKINEIEADNIKHLRYHFQNGVLGAAEYTIGFLKNELLGTAQKEIEYPKDKQTVQVVNPELSLNPESEEITLKQGKYEYKIFASNNEINVQSKLEGSETYVNTIRYKLDKNDVQFKFFGVTNPESQNYLRAVTYDFNLNSKGAGPQTKYLLSEWADKKKGIEGVQSIITEKELESIVKSAKELEKEQLEIDFRTRTRY